jgi:hypothetical protein
MSIFLDQNPGLSAEAFSDCLRICISDGNLGDLTVPADPTVVQLTYSGARPAPETAARLHDMCNNNYGAPIVIPTLVVTALSGGVDPISGFDITGNGITYTDSTSGTTVVRVVYDMNNCNGNGIFVFNTDGDQISLARAPLLYHELSHAFRAATGTNLPNDEPPAETDENVMRAVLGYCLRDINNHNGGCGHGDDCSGPPTPESSGCFIVSATTGSPRSAEVERLRSLRDRVAAGSPLGAQLIERIYAEYYRFSPAIAAQLDQAATPREATLRLVVRPLLAWYALAAALAFDHTDRVALRQAKRALDDACPRLAGRAAVVSVLESLLAGKPVPAGAPRMLRQFAPQIEAAARLPFARWAILDALLLAWRPATHRDPAAAVAQWLASAPLEQLPLQAGAPFEAQLGLLARFFDFDPAARLVLGGRLALARPEIAAVLASHGFVSGGDTSWPSKL